MKFYSLIKNTCSLAELIKPLFKLRKSLIIRIFNLSKNIYLVRLQITFILFLIFQSGCKENAVSPLVFGETTLTDLGLNNIPVSSIVISGANIIVAGCNPSVYIYISKDKGSTWTSQYYPPWTISSPGTNIVTNAQVKLFAEGTNIFAGVKANSGSVSISTDNGITWKQRDPDFVQNVNCFASIGSTIYAGTENGVYLTNDDGLSWNASIAKLSFSVNYLAVIGTTLFASGEYGIFRSTNNGKSWTPTNSGLPNIFINGLAVVGKDIFAGIYQPPEDSSGGVYVSTNNGNSWTACNDGLTNHAIGQLYAGTSILVVGTLYGFFLSNNSGQYWTDISSAIAVDLSEITAIAIYGSDLFLGTNGNGIWLYPLSSN